MLIMCRKVVCEWEPEFFKEYTAKLKRRGVAHNVYKVPILVGPEKEIPKQAPQTAIKRSGFGQDPHDYTIIKPL